ncbi:MAG TPA: glycosyltransferase [Rhodanobacteraceae bacterium]|nr:glycosyltransferase [Rhodanobacteraceae bacterium]
MKSSILYISYDGMLEPLGQSQVLAYLERLAGDYDIHLLSFEKPADWSDVAARKAVAARLQRAQICWHPHRYHKLPTAPATAFDIFVGALAGLWLTWRHGVRIVHARSYVPAVMALIIKRLTGAKFLFDMRGFWANERVDGGLWPRDGRLYRVAKRLERRFLLDADHVVSLTHAAVREMEQFDCLRGRMPPMTVIPTCADLARFLPLPKPAEAAPFTLGYVGAVGTCYQFDLAASVFMILRSQCPRARFLIINKGAHDYISAQLVAAAVPLEAVELREARHADVPALMARMDAGVFFYRPDFSAQARAPTKLAEFLGCGIPCLSNSGVGDMAAILETERVGVAVDTLGAPALAVGVHRLLELCAEPGITARCTHAALSHFSLEEGVKQYARIYRELEGSARGDES